VDKTFATNVKGVIFTVQEALPILGDKASIILTGSTTSTRVGPAQTVYAASKAAVRSLARSWAVDLAGRAIRVNVLSPGPTRTPGLLGTAPGQEDELLAAISTLVPLGRIGEPAKIAAAAVFLASDDASSSTASNSSSTAATRRSDAGSLVVPARHHACLVRDSLHSIPQPELVQHPGGSCTFVPCLGCLRGDRRTARRRHDAIDGGSRIRPSQCGHHG
jgi:hypothetical protein